MIFVSGTGECSRPRYRRRIGSGVDTVRVATASGVALPWWCSPTTPRISSGRPCALGKAYATRGVSTPHDTNQATSSGGDGVKICQRVNVGGPDPQHTPQPGWRRPRSGASEIRWPCRGCARSAAPTPRAGTARHPARSAAHRGDPRTGRWRRRCWRAARSTAMLRRIGDSTVG